MGKGRSVMAVRRMALLVFVLVGGALPLQAAPVPLLAAETTTSGMDLFTLLWKGGWVMIPLALLSIVALTIAIERALHLRRHKVTAPDFATGLKAAFLRGPEQARSWCDGAGGPLARIIKAGLDKRSQGQAAMQAALAESGAREADGLSRSLRPLAVIATIAPLLGLLGTVYGMISAFQASTVASVAGKSDVLATGIYEALVTTAAGLTIAIPVLAIHQYLGSRVERVIDGLDDGINQFLGYASLPQSLEALPQEPTYAHQT